MNRQAVAQEGAVSTGEMKMLALAGVEIGLFHLPDGSWRAYKNFCPHAGAPVCTGEVSKGMPPILRCPWHAWDFDLTTGELVGFAKCALDAYQVEVDDGTVYVWA